MYGAVMEARNLTTTRVSGEDRNTSDSFVEIKLIMGRKSFKSSFKQQNKPSATSVVKSLNPIWNEILEL